jgi:hypothetical protein
MKTTLLTDQRITVFAGADAERAANDLAARLGTDGWDVILEVSKGAKDSTWPPLHRIEQLLYSPDCAVFLLSTELVAVLQRNRVFSEAIYEVVARGKPVHVLLPNPSFSIPACFLSLRGVEVDHFSPNIVTAGASRNRGRTG